MRIDTRTIQRALLALLLPLGVVGTAHAQDGFYEHVEQGRYHAPLQAAQEALVAGEHLLSVPALSVSLEGIPLLRLGSRSEHVRILRQALTERGFPPYSPPPPPSEGLTWELDPHLQAWEMQVAEHEDPGLIVFDEAVLQSVRAAQLHYGLKEDGIAGPRLYQNLADTGRSLGEDLIRWSAELEEHADAARAKGHTRMVVVNIPSYILKAIDLESGQTLLETRVIVGAPGSRTPVFTTNIIDLKYNPDWTPPPSLAARGRRYTRPGPNNPMGRIRFSTDNHINIYLHHTNEPGMFERETRAMSAGCVRVEAWDELAAFLAQSDVDHIHERVETGRTIFEKVQTTPVIMTYSTADVVAGRPVRHPDVYGRGQ